MAPIQVRVGINAPAASVWHRVRDISDHVSWMSDATAIRFTTAKHEGVGAAFDCDTRVGPLRMTDRMVVTAWDEGRAITIRHGGVVSGVGRIDVVADGPARSRVTWTEDLRFPVWLGGAVAARAAQPVLRRIWQANLGRLRDLIQS